MRVCYRMTGRIAATLDIEDTCAHKGRDRTKAIRDIKGIKTKDDHFFFIILLYNNWS